MFKFRKKTNPMIAYIDEAVEDVAQTMLNCDSSSDEYKKANEQFLKLIDLRDRLDNGRKIKPETWALIASNLAGILIVISYERIHVLSSKAFNWISRPKL